MPEMDNYKREAAFRSFESKFCPGCGARRMPLTVFCIRCEGKLNTGVLKGLRRRESFAWAYHEALRLLTEFDPGEP